MAELSLNLEIKGLGTTTMSMTDAKKLYSELKSLFEEKVKYVPTYGWQWQYPWWGYAQNQYGTYCGASHTKGTAQRGNSWSSGGGGNGTVSDYNISI